MHMLAEEDKHTDLSAPVETGVLADEGSRSLGVKKILDGGIVASQMGNVFGMWVDASQKDAVKEISKVKGINKPLSTMLLADDLYSLIQKEHIHPELTHLVESAEKLASRVGSICHVRVPIAPSYVEGESGNGVIPKSILSEDENGTYCMHCLVPEGHTEMESWIREINREGVPFVGVTSLNHTGDPEIATVPDAVTFCQRNSDSIRMLLLEVRNERGKTSGSYAIVDMINGKYVRDGHIPMHVIDKLLEVDLVGSSHGTAKRHRHPQDFDFDKLLTSTLSPEELRKELLKIAFGS